MIPHSINRLFVYGTLAPGEPNDHFLQNLGGQWENATVRGQLFPNGIGPTLGYPALKLDNHGTEIEGLLFSSPRLFTLWQTLDAFEGPGYLRVVTKVALADQSKLDAYIYALDTGVIPSDMTL